MGLFRRSKEERPIPVPGGPGVKVYGDPGTVPLSQEVRDLKAEVRRLKAQLAELGAES